MLSASNILPPEAYYTSPTGQQPTTVLILPAFTLVDEVKPSNVPELVERFIDTAPTTTTPVAAALLPAPSLTLPTSLASRPCPHQHVILLCSQKTRDARCGQSAPLLRKEFERHLRPLGLYRDLDDERPGGVGIYFISHVGGHKYSANVMIYRRGEVEHPAPKRSTAIDRTLGQGGESSSHPKPGERPDANGKPTTAGVNEEAKALDHKLESLSLREDMDSFARSSTAGQTPDVSPHDTSSSATQAIWLARVRPEDCEGIVKYTVLQGKVVKPERQLRGGWDRNRGLTSW
jgi:hypothetical protein